MERATVPVSANRGRRRVCTRSVAKRDETAGNLADQTEAA